LQISHILNNQCLSKDISEEVGFLLSNRYGGFINLGISSRYQGLFFRLNGQVIKVLDDIMVKGPIDEIQNTLNTICRRRQLIVEKFQMPKGKNVLVYKLNKKKEINLLFDVKKPYDNRIWGRIYKIHKKDNCVIVEFEKRTDSREDSDSNTKEFKIYTVIHCPDSNVQIIDNWIKKQYNFDAQRGSSPSERYVNNCLRITSKHLVIASSYSLDEAIFLAKSSTTLLSNIVNPTFKNKRIFLARENAMNALHNLLVYNSDVTMYAGLPWFFQHWSRDTLISIKSLILNKNYRVVKSILLSLTSNIGSDGLLPNRYPHTNTKSSDSIGWLFKGWHDYIDALRKDNLLSKYFKKKELMNIIKLLEESINKIFQKYTRNSLIYCFPQSTWMDTSIGDTTREGFRIEIQALTMFMYDFLYQLTDNKIYYEMLQKIKKKTKQIFWTGSYLRDGSTDSTIRPNIFIAAYIYPDLLSKDQWTTCFDTVLPKLWLPWGGLSTIDISSSKYKKCNTGEDPSSYHNGDSWYWINNLVALVLYKFNKKKYKAYIEKIIKASTEDILFKGYIGCHSELSSASIQLPQGCLNQAWSNAFFYELAYQLSN